jgi:hypothetical protein
MELEFYKNVNDNYPNDAIFCLKNFSKEDLNKLSVELDNLIQRHSPINLSGLNFVNNLTKKTLILETGRENKGIIKISEDAYKCILEKTQFIEMKEIILHFSANEAEMTRGYNWLYSAATDIGFLLSYNGSW